MRLLPAKLDVAALILCSSLITIGLAPIIAVAQNLLPPCPSDPTVVWTDCRGIRTFSSGDEYVGEYRNGKPNGRGTFTWPDGRKYVGKFTDGKFNGRGTYTLPEGEKYVGEFRDDLGNGHGTSTWPSGAKYVGEFRDGKYNGRGTFTWPDGRKYVGEFRDDEFNGQATFTWPDGSKYVGEYRDGKQNGLGWRTWPNGEQYVGDFLNDQPTHGTYTWPDGRKYVGEYDQRNGQGTEFSTATSGMKDKGSSRFDDRVGPLTNRSGIPIETEEGAFIVPVTINGKITLNFTIDSGASDVAVPADVVSTLIRTGSIAEGDFIGQRQYQLADGSTVPSVVFILRSLKVGDKVVINVRANVTSAQGDLLLGQSFLSRFNSWSVDNKQRLLFLN
jgi:clan AA aspartic protease (TIGR02281 family)